MASFGPGWTPEEQKWKRYLEKRIKAAYKIVKQYERTRMEHWIHLRDALRLEVECANLETQVANRAISQLDGLASGLIQREDHWAYEELLERLRDVERTCKQFTVRQSLCSLAAANDLRATRTAFVTLLSSMMETKPRGNRGTFVEELAKACGKKIRPGIEKLVWTPVNGWTSRLFVNAVQIFPLQYGQATMDYVFGKDAYREINSALNGLFIPRVLKDQFDDYRVIIVPLDENSDPPEYKWLVLDKSLYNAGICSGEITFRGLHGRKLEFRTDFRPRARYLYFRYLDAIRHHSRRIGPPDINISELTKAWCRSGSYVRENMLRAYIEYFGNDINEDDIERIRQHSSTAIRNDEVEQMIKAAGELTIIPEDSGSDYDLKEDSDFE